MSYSHGLSYNFKGCPPSTALNQLVFRVICGASLKWETVLLANFHPQLSSPDNTDLISSRL